jgi:membrane fusion protein, multidrug efflux system
MAPWIRVTHQTSIAKSFYMSTDKKKSKSSAFRLLFRGAILIIIMIIGVLLLLSRQNASVAGEVEKKVSDIKKGIPVRAVMVSAAAPTHELVLTGESRPFLTATLYAKTSGYVSKMLVDKGDRVTKGQLLATIISPETDEALRSAISDLENKKKIYYRDTSLVKKNYISVEEAEASQTNVTMAEANVKSLTEQQQYKNIVSPFDGTITARFADPGALVQNAVNSQTSALPLVEVSQLDKIRIYVYVEQKDAAFVKPGYPVTMMLSERPGVVLKDKVTRQAGELDPKTRMELVEIDRQNTDRSIIPGSFVEVHIDGPVRSRLQIPSEALVIRGGKYFAAMIQPDSTIHFQPLTIGENSGINVTILHGLSENDLVGLNVGDNLAEGQKVYVIK